MVCREQLVLDAGADGVFRARLTVQEAMLLPPSPRSAHDAREPYDAQFNPVRPPAWRSTAACSAARVPDARAARSCGATTSPRSDAAAGPPPRRRCWQYG